MSQINIRNLSNENDDGAPDIVGVSTFSATSYFVPPVGNTAQRPTNPQGGDLRFNTDSASLEYFKGDTLNWTQIEMTSSDLDGGHRAVWMGGGTEPADPASTFNIIDYVTISTLGNATDFGDLPADRMEAGRGIVASRTRGFQCGGEPSVVNVTKLEFSSTGSAVDYLDLALVSKAGAQLSDSTRAVVCQGYGTPTFQDDVSYFTMSTNATGADFGDLTTSSHYAGVGFSNSTRGVVNIAYDGSSYVNTLEYCTIQTTGDFQDFGDLTLARGYAAGASNATRGVVIGGYVPSPVTYYNTIDYVTTATLGNATDFGDELATIAYMNAGSSPTRIVIGGGTDGSSAPVSTGLNTITYLQIATTGNVKDFGDLTQHRRQLACASNGHGGL